MNRSESWTAAEKKIARSAFDKAYRLECAEISSQVKTRNIENPDDLWALEAFLSEKRQEISQKYDYRYSVLPLAFARLIAEGWLNIEDLNGLNEEKTNQIKQLEKSFKDIGNS